MEGGREGGKDVPVVGRLACLATSQLPAPRERDRHRSPTLAPRAASQTLQPNLFLLDLCATIVVLLTPSRTPHPL